MFTRNPTLRDTFVDKNVDFRPWAPQVRQTSSISIPKREDELPVTAIQESFPVSGSIWIHCAEGVTLWSSTEEMVIDISYQTAWGNGINNSL